VTEDAGGDGSGEMGNQEALARNARPAALLTGAAMLLLMQVTVYPFHSNHRSGPPACYESYVTRAG